jgi:hypothetical protein
MAHISELALFDYVLGKSDLTTEENEHLKECDDCREELIEFRDVVKHAPDVQKTRRILAEEGEVQIEAEPS